MLLLGIIGHSDRYCSKLFDLPPIPRELYAYGPHLIAQLLRNTQIGEKWLRSERDFLHGQMLSSGMDKDVKEGELLPKDELNSNFVDKGKSLIVVVHRK